MVYLIRNPSIKQNKTPKTLKLTTSSKGKGTEMDLLTLLKRLYGSDNRINFPVPLNMSGTNNQGIINVEMIPAPLIEPCCS